MPPLKVAVLGTVPNTRCMAPFDNPEIEIWVCSPGNRGDHVLPRVTRWFEIHGLQDMLGVENRGWCPEYFAWLKSKSFQVYMQEPNDEVPQATIFPYKEVIRHTGTRLPFTSSVSWMVAYAMMLGASEISIWGVEMAADSEAYSGQKYGCLHIIEIAKSRGIKVEIPLESTLATYFPLYGYGEATRMGRSLFVRGIEIERGINDLKATIERLTKELCHFQGAKEQNEFVRRTYVDGYDAEIDYVENVKVIEAPKPIGGESFSGGTFTMGAGGVLVPMNGEQPAAEKHKRERNASAVQDKSPRAM